MELAFRKPTLNVPIQAENVFVGEDDWIYSPSALEPNPIRRNLRSKQKVEAGRPPWGPTLTTRDMYSLRCYRKGHSPHKPWFTKRETRPVLLFFFLF